MQEEHISFSTSKALHQAGFNEATESCYDEHGSVCELHPVLQESLQKLNGDKFYPRPSQALAARWIREEHGLTIIVMQTNLPLCEPPTDRWEWGFVIQRVDNPDDVPRLGMYYPSYEEAMEAGLDKALQLITDNGDRHETGI